MARRPRAPAADMSAGESILGGRGAARSCPADYEGQLVTTLCLRAPGCPPADLPAPGEPPTQGPRPVKAEEAEAPRLPAPGRPPAHPRPLRRSHGNRCPKNGRGESSRGRRQRACASGAARGDWPGLAWAGPGANLLPALEAMLEKGK